MRKPALVLATLALLLLSGCQTDDPTVVPQPAPTTTPLFASDEEALAAAEEAYGAYLAVSDQILAEGGAEPERAYVYLTETMQAEADKGLSLYVDEGLHTSGTSTFDSFELQQLANEDPTIASLTAYGCLDVSGVRVLDAAGTDVTPKERPNRLPLELEFVAEGSKTFLLERSDLWSGDDFCN